MMQFGDLIITSNGTGTVDEFYVGDIQSIEHQVMENLLTILWSLYILFFYSLSIISQI